MRDLTRDMAPAVEPLVTSVPGAARPLVVVAGALIALQSSPTLDLSKVAFAIVASVALVGSIRRIWLDRDSALVGEARPWLIASLVLAAIMALSLPVAVANGTPVGTWLRDAASYGLVAAAPWLAVDLGASVSPRLATWLIVIAGSLGTAAFTLNWVQRRHIVDLPVDRLVLPSFTLATAFIAFAVAQAVWADRRRLISSVAAATAIGLLLATGTRTTLALVAIPIVLFADAVRVGGRRMVRGSFVPAVLPLVLVAVVVGPGMLSALTRSALGPPLAIPSATASATATGGSGGSGGPLGSVRPVPTGAPSTAEPPGPAPTPVDDGRFGTIDDVVSGNDASLRLRWAQTESAWKLFVGSPLYGQGLGVSIPWINIDGSLRNSFLADTPITVLAKFGVFGIAIWVVLAWATLDSLRRLRRQSAASAVARSALAGFAVGLVALAPFGPQLEDKGTGIALILLLGLAFTRLRGSATSAIGIPAGG